MKWSWVWIWFGKDFQCNNRQFKCFCIRLYFECLRVRRQPCVIIAKILQFSIELKDRVAYPAFSTAFIVRGNRIPGSSETVRHKTLTFERRSKIEWWKFMDHCARWRYYGPCAVSTRRAPDNKFLAVVNTYCDACVCVLTPSRISQSAVLL